MDRRKFLKSAGISTVVLGSGAWRFSENKKSVKRPNILVVIADQFRIQALGFRNQDPVFTPNLDRFARESMIVDNAISNCPVSTPFRGMFLSGKFPLTTGVTQNCSPEKPGLYYKPDATSMGTLFKNAGYQTGYIGKWHLDDPQDRIQRLGYDPDNGRGWDTYTAPGPMRQGFDFWHAFNAYDHHMNPHYWENSKEMIIPGKWSVEHEVDTAIDFIKKRKKDTPFLLCVSHVPPHPPYNEVPEEYRTPYKGKKLLVRENVELKGEAKNAQNAVEGYFAAVTGVDENFGRLINFLDQENLREDTIVLFISDHGEMMGSHGRMQKSIFYEEAANIPFILRYPRKVKAGVTKELIGVPDILPSLLSLSGLKIPSEIQGTDLSEMFLGKVPANAHKSMFLGIYQGSPMAPSAENWKKSGWRAIRTKDHTFVADRRNNKNQWLLYDNQKDPWQMNPKIVDDVSSDPEIQPYHRELEQWMNKIGDPFLNND